MVVLYIFAKFFNLMFFSNIIIKYQGVSCNGQYLILILFIIIISNKKYSSTSKNKTYHTTNRERIFMRNFHTSSKSVITHHSEEKIREDHMLTWNELNGGRSHFTRSRVEIKLERIYFRQTTSI